MENTISMEYMYRDADNYKAFGAIHLTGEFNFEYEKIIRGCLEIDDLFIAEQMNIPTLYSQLWEYSDGIISADHAYHEFIRLKPFLGVEVQGGAIWGNIENLITLFISSKDRWNCTKSVHCNILKMGCRN